MTIGPIKVTWTSLKTGVIAALIVAPVNTVLVLLFRYAKPKYIKSPMQEYLEKQRKLKMEEKRQQKQLMKQQKKNHSKTNTAHATPNDSNPNEAGEFEMEECLEHENTEENPIEKSVEPNEIKDNSSSSAEPPKVVKIDTRKKKKFWLPHWVIYIGYALAFVTVIFLTT